MQINKQVRVRVNEMIRAKEVRVVDEGGEQAGVELGVFAGQAGEGVGGEESVLEGVGGGFAFALGGDRAAGEAAVGAGCGALGGCFRFMNATGYRHGRKGRGEETGPALAIFVSSRKGGKYIFLQAFNALIWLL